MTIRKNISVGEVIDLAGGKITVSYLLTQKHRAEGRSVSQSAIDRWIERGRIPEWYWFDMIEMVRVHSGEKISVDALYDLNERAA